MERSYIRLRSISLLQNNMQSLFHVMSEVLQLLRVKSSVENCRPVTMPEYRVRDFLEKHSITQSAIRSPILGSFSGIAWISILFTDPLLFKSKKTFKYIKLWQKQTQNISLLWMSPGKSVKLSLPNFLFNKTCQTLPTLIIHFIYSL